MVPEVLEKYPNSTFVGGQLIIRGMYRLSRVLHNFTIFSIQRRLYKHGLTTIIIPISLDKAIEVIKHITNRGKYPFCYQKLEEEATLHSCIAIFGKTIRQSAPVALLAEKVYDHYSIPFLTIVFVKSGDQYLLSSLAPTKYSQMSDEERSLLAAYLSHQDFL